MVCNDIAVGIWEICIGLGVHISAAHIPGIHNVLADEASRCFADASEWMLSAFVFTFLTGVYDTPDIDLFASRLNKQLPVHHGSQTRSQLTLCYVHIVVRQIYLFISSI